MTEISTLVLEGTICLPTFIWASRVEVNFVRCRNIMKADSPNHRSRILTVPYFLFFWAMVIPKLPCPLYLASTECLCKFDYL